MEIIELTHFRFDGFGWTCNQCRELTGAAGRRRRKGHRRLYLEGEAESRAEELSSKGLAQWGDPERRSLFCPRCGRTERMPDSDPIGS